MRNILIIIILVIFFIFVIIVVISEYVKGQCNTNTVRKQSQFIDVSDLANSEQFMPKAVGVSGSDTTTQGMGLGLANREEETQSIPKVTGAIFGQGFEVNKVDKNFRSGNGAIFTSVRCS